MMKKRWKVSPANRELQEVLGKGLGILPLTAQLLVNRGLVDCDKAFCFLNPDLKDLHSPFLMKGMDKAVERVSRAVFEREKVVIYGDYDVDGTTSTALLYLFFKELGLEVSTYIPCRHREGYGLNGEAVKRLAAGGASLIITVDCGSSNHGEVALASSLGVDVIITDHHEIPEPPQALAVINPRQKDCAFPFKGLAGVGVAFNLAAGLRARLRELGWFKREEPNLKRYLDLVAIGTVADIVPLMDENRVFVSYGLKELEAARRPGIKALLEVARLGAGLTAENIAFQLAPRINAAGRLSNAATALRLLTTEDPREAGSLAEELNSENAARQRLEEAVFNEALSMLGEVPRGIVLASEGWHPGVVGIVASRLAERFFRPAVMIALEGEVGKGSARGIRSFDILEGLRSCSSTLERFGGHRAAAGLTVARGNVERFRAEFLRYLDCALPDEALTPEITLDAVVSLDVIDHRQVSEIERLCPFGAFNSEPLLGLTEAHIVETEVVGSRHLRFKVRHNGCARNGIGFGLAGLHPIRGEGYGIAFSPFVDEWQGVKNLRLKVKDVRKGA